MLQKERNLKSRFNFSEPKRFNSIYEEILEPNPVISTHSSIIRGNKYDHDLAKRTSERHAPDGSDCK